MISHACVPDIRCSRHTPKREKIGTSSLEVAIQAQNIVIPHIPTSVRQAHNEYRQLGAHIQQVIADLDKDLVELYVRESNETPLSPTLRVRIHEVEAVHFFNRMVEDKDFEQLNKPLIESWNTRPNALVVSGVAA